tara:strand:- start:241 stop:558 length:318 start_codon:yes stop_codon:yes gene_type:complete
MKETIMKPVISTLVLTFAIGAVSAPAFAGEVCMPAQELKASLVDWYGEEPVPNQQDGNVQVWASEMTGTWSAVKTLSDGTACVTAQGTDWMAGLETQQTIIAALD